MIQWLFFDLGCTLIDESVCVDYRMQLLLRQPGAPDRETLVRHMIHCAQNGGVPYKDTARKFGLTTVPWPWTLEQLYPGVPELLSSLRGRYRLGVIANQVPGAERRIIHHGIRDCFDVFLASAEEGLCKPDPAFFRRALSLAGCAPEEACMIGDRLDYDIQPAAALGMHTVWVRQSFFGLGDPSRYVYQPEHTIAAIEDLPQIL